MAHVLLEVFPGNGATGAGEAAMNGESAAVSDHEPSPAPRDRRRQPQGVMPTYLREMASIPLLDGRRERDLFRRLDQAREELLALGQVLPAAYAPSPVDDDPDAPPAVIGRAERVHDALELALRARPRSIAEQVVLRARALRREIDSCKEQLVLANLRLVVHVAKRYANRGLALADLVQEGNLGLMRAIEKFEVRRGHKLSTYAHWWIKQAVVRALADKVRLIRLPVHLHERRRKIAAAASDLGQDLGRSPEPAEIADRLQIPLESVERSLDVVPEPTALEESSGEEGGGSPLSVLADPGAVSPWVQLARRDLTRAVEHTLRSLPPREERVLRLRFGIGLPEPCTLDEIGERIHVSRERARQIEAAALRRLRAKRALEDFRDVACAS